MHKRTLVALGALVILSGCQKKAEGQTVALVNDEEITASELNAELANANLPESVDKKVATDRVLQGLIERRLLAEQARKDGIDRSPEFLARQRRMNEELLIGMMANRSLETSKLPTDAEITAFQAQQPQAFANRQVWKLEQLQYDTPRDQSIQNRIIATKSLDQLAAVLTQARIPFQRANNQLVTSAVPAELFQQLNRLEPGEPFIVPAGTKSVASVIASREPSPLTGPTARTEAVNAIRRQNSTKLLQQRLKELRTAAKIEYKEGFTPPKS